MHFQVQEAWEAGQILELCDSNLKGAYIEYEYINLIKLSLCCIKASAQSRPSMSQVVQGLRNLGLVQGGPLRSINGRPFYDSQNYSVEVLEAEGSEVHGTDAYTCETGSISSRLGSLSPSVSIENWKSASSTL